MNEKTMRQIEAIKNQTIGVEIEIERDTDRFGGLKVVGGAVNPDNHKERS